MPPVSFEYASYASGINAAALPLRNIRPDELPLMVNATVRNGYAQTRPTWEWQPLSFIDAGINQYTFEQGKFQGCGQFLSDQGNRAVFVVDGQVMTYDPVANYIEALPLANGGRPFSKLTPHAWVQQRGKWVIVQDGQSAPFRSDGVTSEQTTKVYNPESGEYEPSVPSGTIMAEGWHRLFVADVTRRRVYASDHDMDPVSTPISFTEGTDYYLNARYFEVPPALGRIMGMKFSPYQDTSTGIGPLLIFCEKGVQAYNVAVPRSQWVSQDITQTILPSVGASSFFGYSDKGADLVFRDQEGRIRTIRNAQQFQASGANYTNDFTIWNLLKGEDYTLRRHSHAVTFDRRTLVLTHPERVFLPDKRYAVVHRGIAVMENEHLSDKQDVWSFWTGLNICGLVVVPIEGEEVLIAFCRDPDGVNRIYRMNRGGQFDIMPDGRQARVQMTLSLPSLDFGNAMKVKTLKQASVKLTGMRGEVTVCGRWQADNEPLRRWFTHSEVHPHCMQFSQEPCGLLQMASGTQAQLVLPAPPTARAFRAFSFTLDVFGPAAVEEMQLTVEEQQDNQRTNVSCSPKQLSKAEAACGVDLLCYSAHASPEAPQPSVPTCRP